MYNLNGQKKEELINGFLKVGKYKLKYNAANLSSGVYFYKLSSDQVKELKSFLLIE